VTRLWSDATRKTTAASENAELRDAVLQTQTARSAEATSVAEGNIEVVGEGQIISRYLNGQAAVRIGPAPSTAGGLHGTGLYVRSEQNQQIFWATHASDGRTEVVMGVNDDRVGRIWSKADEYWSRTYGLHRIQTLDGAECHVLADGNLWLDTNSDLDVSADGNIGLIADGSAALGGATGTFLQPESGAGVANVRMDTVTGRITYVPSTVRAKRDIQDLPVDTATVLQLRPRTWLPGPGKRHCPDWVHERHTDPDQCCAGETVEPPADAPREVGFVAEELDELGLNDFVEYDSEGLPASIRYDRLAAALIPLAQQQQSQIDALTEQVKQLAARVAERAPEPNTRRQT
jgi:hypothetical protein